MKVAPLQVAGNILVPHVELATGIGARMRGLLGRSGLGEGGGMFLSPCGSIHTYFMRFTIDVIFLDATMRVVRVCPGIRPFRFAFGGRRAAHAIEVESGWLDLVAFTPGATCCLRND